MSAQPDWTDWIENRTFDEITVGESAHVTSTLSRHDIELFAAALGDVDPAHIDPSYTGPQVADDLWGAALFSSILSTRLPGPGAICESQTLRFLAPVAIGDTITASVTATHKDPKTHRIEFECRCVNQGRKTVTAGVAIVLAPIEKKRLPRTEMPQVRIADHLRFHTLMSRASGGKPIATAVAHPCDAIALGGVIDAAQAGLIAPILIGPRSRIETLAKTQGWAIDAFPLVDAPHSHAAAAAAVAMVREGRAMLLMKGSLHTDELMHAVMADNGLRTDRRISHVYVMDVPGQEHPLLITDAAINIAPTLEQKRDIVQNAIELAHAIGITTPKVAILSAVETINPVITSTLDAAALCKMAERGQITGGIVDGPLALDNAVSPSAAREKGIVSPVAGMADVLVAPNLESANILAKQLTFLGDADAAGLVMGARVPIILTSRADSPRARVASCALAVLLARRAVPTVTSVAEC